MEKVATGNGWFIYNESKYEKVENTDVSIKES